MSQVIIKANPKIRRGALMESYKLCTDVRQQNFDVFLKDDSDMGKWIMRIRDLEGEWVGGEYLLEVEAPDEFPFKAPKFLFLTPNGLYKHNEKVCISIGEYHNDNYPATMRIGMFIYTLIGAMIVTHSQSKEDNIKVAGGYNILSTPKEHKQLLAQQSKAFNTQYYPQYVKIFETLPHNELYNKVRSTTLSGRSLTCVLRWLSLIE